MKMIHTWTGRRGAARRKALPALFVMHACIRSPEGQVPKAGTMGTVPFSQVLLRLTSLPASRLAVHFPDEPPAGFRPVILQTHESQGYLKKTLLFPAPHGMVRSPGSKRSLSILQSLAIPVDRYPTPFPLPLFDYFRGIPTRPE